MISSLSLKRKSLETHSSSSPAANSTLTKKFRPNALDGKTPQHEQRMSLLATKKLNMINGGETVKPYKAFDESQCTPLMLAEYRRLQHELQCQEALLVLMQKLKSNQRLISTTNNNGVKQRATATKLNQQTTANDGKTPLTATKQPAIAATNNVNRVTPNKTPHPNQYTVNRSNVTSQNNHSSKTTAALNQATRQSATPTTNNSSNAAAALPTSATRLSSTVPTSATKNSSNNSTTNSASKSNGVAAEQHLLNAKLALRKQLEQTLLQIPTPKPSTCDLTFIPGVNGWSEFLAYLGLEQAFNIYNDIVNRRPPSEMSMNLPYVCAQCGTDWSVTWHEMSSTNDSTNGEEKILCDRCTKTSQKKLLKQDHSNRLRQAFIKALQQEKELDAKFQNQTPTSSSTPEKTTSTSNATSSSSSTNTIKPSPSSQSLQSSKHAHSSSKHSSKPLSTKTSSNHHHHHHHHNSSSSGNSNNHNHHHSHHHSSKSTASSSSSKSHHSNASSLASLSQSPAEALASTLAALQNTEHMELFQKHFLSNMLPFAVANQAAAAAALAKSSQQQHQQQAALAAFPAMAASLMRQPNPAQYLLDMIPQAAKQHQQQQQQQHHSK